MMKAAEVRSRFLKFFESQGHTIVESSSLVPSNDPSLLFTTAGMVQFKDVFLGKDIRPYKRAATAQKCVRAGGKHNDLENVGFTARHHTFFEMLGNFSFGDYFKKDAIRFAWQFVTQELKLPKDRLYVSVFEKDDEAADIWHHQEGIPRDRIYRFGEKDNFWAMGDTGPCGPCSEIFFDRGEKYGCNKPTCKMGCDCDRYLEFWNLVFMQYERDESGEMNPLPRPSVDTGAGLERIAMILQDVPTNYDTDIFKTILEKIAQLAGKPYAPGDALSPSFRVIADHSRATAFLIADGVLPSNEGRGYVLRRIMRRAIRHGKKIGFTGPFLHRCVQFVAEQMKEAYPSVIEQIDFITKAVHAEEEQFFRTLERGLALLDDEIAKLKNNKQKMLSGDVAFTLYDTFGFPLDLTRVILTEKGLSVDEAGFEAAMNRQRSESKKNWKGTGEEALSEVYLKLAQELKTQSKLPEFVGYDSLSAQSACTAIIVRNGNDLARTSSAKGPSDQPVFAVFQKTPFYGESGGQIGDKGRVSGKGFDGEVVDVKRPVSDLIVAEIKIRSGELKVGETYLQETDRELRALTARNHTATHLLHWALRDVLGKHVKQAGSLVSDELLRFDFSHFQAMTEGELMRVENLINEKIWSDYSVSKREMNKDEAIKEGAIAFFGEKYGNKVRVVKVGDFSVELCGGTHVDRAGEIHLFKIESEGGIAAGVRRIIARTSKRAFAMLDERSRMIDQLAEKLKANSLEDVLIKFDRLTQTERELRKTIEKLQAKSAAGEVDRMLSQAASVGDAKIVAAVCDPSDDGIKRLREISDQIQNKDPKAVAILGIQDTQGLKASLLISVGKQAPKTIQANALLQKIVSLIDGKGGGKPDLAQAGGSNPKGLENAVNEAKKIALEQGQAS